MAICVCAIVCSNTEVSGQSNWSMITAESTSSDSSGIRKLPKETNSSLVSVRGYLQVRYHGLLQTNDELKCQQCDRAWGAPASFSLRRARLVFSGSVNNRISFYVAPDIASTVSSVNMNYAQLRDAYFDIVITQNRDWRVRLGLSKIPYSFENLQSSSNRLSLDRHDGTNSAITNERDMGAFLFWSPSKRRELFKEINDSGLKGTGDYGVVAFGVYNGQGANESDLNSSLHAVARISYPFRLGRQILEPGIQGFVGTYSMIAEDLSGLAMVHQNNAYDDKRMALSFVAYPKPIGFQAEYNWGAGPEFNPENNHIENRALNGGYLLLNAKTRVQGRSLIPFIVAHHYKGGKKFEVDARSYRVRELELGAEWQPFDQFELTAVYTLSSRRFEDALKPHNLQEGSLLRLQAQVSF